MWWSLEGPRGLIGLDVSTGGRAARRRATPTGRMALWLFMHISAMVLSKSRRSATLGRRRWPGRQRCRRHGAELARAGAGESPGEGCGGSARPPCHRTLAAPEAAPPHTQPFGFLSSFRCALRRLPMWLRPSSAWGALDLAPSLPLSYFSVRVSLARPGLCVPTRAPAAVACRCPFSKGEGPTGVKLKW